MPGGVAGAQSIMIAPYADCASPSVRGLPGDLRVPTGTSQQRYPIVVEAIVTAKQTIAWFNTLNH